MKPQQAKPQQVKRSQLSQPPLTPSQSREVIAFIIGVLRLTDNAANHVIAFFQTLGLSGPIGLPREFMLELGALLQFREWHNGGVVPWHAPDGGTIDDRISLTMQQFIKNPMGFFNTQRGTEAMGSMLLAWTEKCSPVAREHLGCDIAIQWDHSCNLDHIVESLADFVWRYRHCGQTNEASR